jgi:hypothetical protein
MTIILATICIYGFAQALGNYTFSHAAGSYVEISGGTLLGDESTLDQKFVDPASPLGGTAYSGVGFPLGFDFYFNGYTFDRVGISAEGWLGLGQSWQPTPLTLYSNSYYAPLGSTAGINPPWQNSRVAGLAVNLAAQAGATLRIETIGTAPNREFVAQWQNYRKNATSGDSFNFQIRLQETTNKVVVVYGGMTCNATAANVQVGMRGEPANSATNFANRTTTMDWAATDPGTVATNTCTLSRTVFPASGTTFSWTPPAPLDFVYEIGSGGDFTTFSAAIDFLNANYPLYGIPEGGTVFNVLAGQVFTEEPPPITATGAPGHPITFQRSGAGANPLLKVAGTTSTTDAAIRIESGDYFTFDGIDISNADGITSLEIGFHLAASIYNGCLNNTLTNCTVTLSRTNTNSKGVYTAGANVGGNDHTTIDGLAISDSYYGIHLSGYSTADYNDRDNLVTDCVLSDIAFAGVYFQYCNGLVVTQNQISMCAGNSAAFRGIYSTGNVSTTADVSYNTIIGNTTSTTAYGLYADEGSVSWHHNEIKDFTGTGSSPRYGFYLYDRNHEIYANHIHNINGAGHVYGIYTGSYTDVANIHGNLIHDLQYTGPSGSAYAANGIHATGTTVTIANNMIYDLGSTGDGAPMIRGITTNTGGTFNIYYNTIYLKGGGTNSNFGSAGLYLYSSGPTLDLRNNIVVDLSTPGTGTTGRAAAIWKGYAGFSNFAASCDRNLYYAGVPGPKNLICYDNGTSYESLLDYKNAVGGLELGSLTESVPFVSVEEPYDVHISTTVPTAVEANALPILGWDVDYDGNDRDDSNPDIGADEGNFLIPAVVPDPAVVISPTDGEIVIQPSATLNWSPAASGGVPTGYQLYLGTDDPPTNIIDGLDLGNMTSYDPDPDLNFLTTYNWRVVPYNASGSTPVASCPIWSFETHAAPLTGSYTIGSTGYYPNFTLAITHLNAAGVGTGGVTYLAAAGETFAENPPLITASGTADDPILFTRDGTGDNPLLTPTGGDGTYGFRIEGGDWITFDHIDIANVSGATDLVHGFWIYSPSGNGADYNTIQDCNITLSRSLATWGIYMSGSGNSHGLQLEYNQITEARRGIYLDPGSEAYDIQITGNTITNSSQYAIYNDNSTDSQISGNVITFPTATSDYLIGIHAQALINAEIYDNTVSGGSTTSYCYGLSQSGGTSNWHHNTVTNLTCEDGMEGFNATGGTVYIHDNTFSGLTSLNQTVYGLELSFENSGTATAYNNLIHDLSSSTVSGNSVQGIISNGTSNLLYNNMVYDLRNPTGTSAPQVMGINVSNRTAALYYNTVYLDPNGTNDNYSSAAFYVSGGSSILTANNIFMNSGTPGSSGMSAAFWKTADGFDNIDPATDHNLLYAGTPGAHNLICYTPSASYQSLDDYKAAVSFDQASLTEAVPFASAVSPYDVHIAPGASTLAESNGIPIVDITDDFDGDFRNATTPDIGADEGDFLVPALVPAPAIASYPLSGYYAVEIQPTLSWYASASGGAPTGFRIYFGSDNPPTDIENGTDLGNVLTYTSSATLDFLTTYYWQIVPYNDNGSAVSCPVWEFSTHQAPLTGTWIIGSTGFYPDFTHAVNYLNASGVGSGGVTFQAIAGETFDENPPAIRATGTSSDPVTFTSTAPGMTNPLLRVDGGASDYAIKIEGGDFITFDHIDIANAPGGNDLLYGFWLEAQSENGATDNTIQSCGITLDRSFGGSTGIRSDSSSGRINHRNRYLNNSIANAQRGIYLYDTSAAITPLVQGNIISDVADYGIYSRTSNGIEIAQNQIGMAEGNTISFTGIYCYNESTTGYIHHNTVSGGSSTQVFHGIYHHYNTFQIHDNIISDVTSSNVMYGIRNYYTASNAPVYGNQVFNLNCTGNSTVTGLSLGTATSYQNSIYGLTSNGQVIGIYINGGSSYRNLVHGLQSNSTGSNANGYVVYGSATVHNNMVYDLSCPNSDSVPQVRGIYIGNGTSLLYYNSVLLTASGSAANSSSAALAINTGSSIKLINNIFSNLSSPGASGMSMAFWKAVGGFAELSEDCDNNIWYAGTPGAQNLICYHGTLACVTLDDYKTANLGKDQNSFTENVPFASVAAPYDLHLNAGIETYAEGNALVIAGIGEDYDGEARDASHPDIGADEGDFTPISAPPAVPVYLSPANGATGLALSTELAWAPGSGGGLPDNYDVYFGTTTPPPQVATGVTTTEYQPYLLPSSTYYWKIDAVNTLGTATGPVWSFSTRTDDTIMEYPFLESFEDGNTPGSTAINRWTQALGSGSNYWTVNNSTTYNRAPRTGQLNLTLSAFGDAWLFRPIYLEAGQTYSLELWARQYTSSGAQAYLQVRYGTNPSVAGMNNTIINIQEFVNGGYQSGTATFTPPSTGIWYLGIHGVCSNPTNFLSLDDLGISYYVAEPNFSIAPTSWNFGMVEVGGAGTVKEFVVTNVGDADLLIAQSDIYLDGADADDFILTDPGSDLTITPGNSASLFVGFEPQSLGVRNAELVIVDNMQRATHQVPLNGRGIGPLEPPFVMGFEEGWIDWVVVNGEQPNKWELGTAAPYRNSYSAYVSSNYGATHAYNPNASSCVHFYHDVVFPADMSGLRLKFNWKCMGEAGFDYLSVHLTDTTFVPEAGVNLTLGQIGTDYAASNDWQVVSLDLDPALAGQTRRLIFSWRNDGGGGAQVPAAVDNIRIIGGWPVPGIPQNLTGSISAGAGVLSWDPVDGALDYIIEDADMFDGTFSPAACSGNPSWIVPGDHPRRFFRIIATD